MSTRSSRQKRALKERLAARFGWRCAHCGCRDDDLTLDHIVPRAQGGSWHISNLQLLCRECNVIKADSVDPRRRRW